MKKSIRIFIIIAFSLILLTGCENNKATITFNFSKSAVLHVDLNVEEGTLIKDISLVPGTEIKEIHSKGINFYKIDENLTDFCKPQNKLDDNYKLKKDEKYYVEILNITIPDDIWKSYLDISNSSETLYINDVDVDELNHYCFGGGISGHTMRFEFRIK